MTIRYAENSDIARMVQLSDAKRTDYEIHSPIYWRRAADANAQQKVFFEKILHHSDWIALVHEVDGNIDGYVIGHLTASPPVYDMGGEACLIHDFVMDSPGLWSVVGKQLLETIEQKAYARHAVVTVIVCGAHDTPKQEFLNEAGAHVASEWRVHVIDKDTPSLD